MKLTKRKLKLLVKEELQKLYEDDDSCEPGTTFPAGDGCNTCTCPDSGKKSEAPCTEKACGDEGDFGKFNENIIDSDSFQDPWLNRNYLQPLVDKGWKHVRGLPLKIGTKHKVMVTGCALRFDNEPIFVVTESLNCIKGMNIPAIWTVDLGEQDNLVGTNVKGLGKVYAVLVK